jgi:hypothetical protein
MRSALILSFLLTVSAVSEAQDPKAILGVWKGTSLCVNREATPACRDENVILEFREATPPAPGKLNLKADKVVNGEVVPMGELDFVWDAKAGAWACELQTRYHGLWSYPPPKGDELSGTLVLLPDRTVVRKAAARRSNARN